MSRPILFVIFLSVFGGGALFAPDALAAANLSVSPPTGTFEVGSTFTVSLFLDTGADEINALDVILSFPPDKLQVVSPSAGKSIIEIWTAVPSYDNEKGEIRLQGGIPAGIKVSQGLLAQLTFRVRTTGEAVLRFRDGSRVLANDGKGTDILGDTRGGFYNLVLPPPAGPLVVSETHPDQTKWYANSTVVLSWPNVEGAEAFSYVLNNLPIDVPDDTAEGSKQSVAYRNLQSGTHYFHIKALREGSWGGVTHFAVNVDIDPPARFPVEVAGGPITTSKTVLIRYQTTDRHSGIDHYEYAVIPLFEAEAAQQSIFVEGKSPTQLTLQEGKYDVVVRAYDKAGNFQESTARVRVVESLPLFFLLLLVERPLWWLVLLAITIILAAAGWNVRKWYHRIILKHEQKELPVEVQKQLEELKEYRRKYGKYGGGGTATMGLMVLLAGTLIAALAMTTPVSAQGTEISPPIVTTVSRNIANDEIFYVGGKTDGGNIPVTIYLQNLQTGETISRVVTSDNRGDWFYRHDTFLSSGKYLLWVQERVGDLVSPPSPQIELQVEQTALQLGASRISFETFYLIAVLLLLAVNAGLAGYTFVHAHRARKRHAAWLKEVHEAEQSVRRGFAVLKRDIEAELALIRQAKLSKELSEEEKRREEQLLKDLAWAEQYIGKEIWDVERAEHED